MERTQGMGLLRAVAVVLAIGALAACSSTGTGSGSSATHLERWSANARSTGTIAGGQTAQITVVVTRWSTEDQRTELLESLTRDGNRQMSAALRTQEVAGWIRTTDSLRWDLRYAREVETDGGRRIIMATDRPVGFGEAARQTRSLDYDTSLIILELDDGNRGTGTVFVGAELELDPETNTLTVTGASSRPVELVNVRGR